MNFDAYVESKTYRSLWVREPGLSVYVRSRTFSSDIDYVLATLEADKPGRGALTRFLDRIEPKYSIKFENVINPRLVRYLKRRGYTLQSLDSLADQISPQLVRYKSNMEQRQ